MGVEVIDLTNVILKYTFSQKNLENINLSPNFYDICWHYDLSSMTIKLSSSVVISDMVLSFLARSEFQLADSTYESSSS